MASERDNRLVEKAVQSGKLSRAQVAESQRMQQALQDQGVRKSLVEILEDEGAVTRSELAKIDDEDGLLGRTLGGFLIEAKLGEGGMGAVYRAKQISLGRKIAIKVLTPQHARNPEFVGRFLREARSAARLNHPHVVQPLEIGAEQGFHYFAMELCEGGSVAGRLEKDGRYAERDALEVVRAVGLALAYADELTIVHRDIKPDNILLTRTGIPKLADLGLAKGEGESITMTGMIMGTPNYMSPEQARGQGDLDSRTDMYALGITLFEMVTGKVPFRGGTPLVILNQHVNEPLPDPRSLAPHLSDDVVALIRRLTAKNRDERFRKPAEMVVEIERMLGHKPSFAAETIATPRATPPPVAGGQRPGSGGQRATPAAAAAVPPASGGSKVPSVGGHPPQRPPSAGGPPPQRPPGAGGHPPGDGGEKKRAVTPNDETVPAPSGGTRAVERPKDDPERPARSRREKDPGGETVDLPPAPVRRGSSAAAVPSTRTTPSGDAPATPRRRARTLFLLLAVAALGALASRPDWRARVAQSASFVWGEASTRIAAWRGASGPGVAPPPGGSAAKPPASAGNGAPTRMAEDDDQLWTDEVAEIPPRTTRPATPAEADARAKELLAAADIDEKAGAYSKALDAVRAARALDAAPAVHERADELLYRTALLVALGGIKNGEPAMALDAIGNVPRAASAPTADAAVVAVCARADALRRDLEALRGALSDIAAGRFTPAHATLAALGKRTDSELARASGGELPAMLAFSTACEQAEAGDYASARTTIEQASPGLAASRFAHARDADVRALLSEVVVAPRLASVVHAEAAPTSGRRFRFAWRFVPDAGARAAELTDWSVDATVWAIDAQGLFAKPAVGPSLRHPADLPLPLRRLDSVEISVKPERSQVFLVTVGPVHVAVMEAEGRVVAGTGKWPETKPAGRVHAFEPPADWLSGKAVFSGEKPYTVAVAITHPADATDAPRATVSIDGVQALSLPLPAPQAGAARADPRVEIRASHTLHVRSVVVEGAPDWPALEKKLPK